MLRKADETESPRLKDDLLGLKVLVVEDTPDARRLIGRMLTGAGAQVYSASNVSEARALLKEFEPDAIVSDIGMPEEDGISFIKGLRDEERFQGKHIPAVALTAYIESTYKHLTLKAGFEAHLCKPVSSAVLIDTIRSVVRTTRSPLH